MAIVAADNVGSSSSTKYTVKFNTLGGTSITEKKVVHGKKVSRPSNPSKSGYTFVTWLLDDKTYNFNNPVTKNITLVASWKKNSSTSSENEKKQQDDEEKKRQEELENKKNAELNSINSTLKYVDDCYDNISMLLSMVYNILAEDIIVDDYVFRGTEIQNIKNKLN